MILYASHYAISLAAQAPCGRCIAHRLDEADAMTEKAAPEAYAVAHDGWGELVLSRSARRNAIVGPMVADMRAALASLLAAKARVILLRGDGGSILLRARRRRVRADAAAGLGGRLFRRTGPAGTYASLSLSGRGDLCARASCHQWRLLHGVRIRSRRSWAKMRLSCVGEARDRHGRADERRLAAAEDDGKAIAAQLTLAPRRLKGAGSF